MTETTHVDHVLIHVRDAFATDAKEVFANGEAIQMFHQPDAARNADTMVFFRRSDVISTVPLGQRARTSEAVAPYWESSAAVVASCAASII